MKRIWFSGCLVLGTFGSVGAVSLAIDTVITGHTGWTTGGALSPDGRQLALVSRSTVYLTDLKTGRQTPLPGHLGPVTRVAYSPDGQVLFTGGNDGTLKRWDTRVGRLLSSVQACETRKDAPQYHEAVSTIAVQSGGDVVVGCDSSVPKAENFRAAVYDTVSGNLLFELGGRSDYVQGLAFSPDGRTMLTTGRSSAKLAVGSGTTGQGGTVTVFRLPEGK